MPFGWAGDAAWCATLSTTRRASTYTGSAAAGGRKGVREKSLPAFDGRYPGMPCAVWDTRIAPVPCPIARHQETSEKKQSSWGTFDCYSIPFQSTFSCTESQGAVPQIRGGPLPLVVLGKTATNWRKSSRGHGTQSIRRRRAWWGGAPLYSRYLRTQDKKCF